MKTILAVDDSVLNLKSIKRLLSTNYKVIAVNSAKDAFNYLSGARPDLILLDLLMPDMDGFQIMEVLKQNPATADIPIIFITADEDKEKEVQGFRMGAMDFIRKPFEPDIVLSRIAKTLELESLRHHLESEVEEKTREIKEITLQSIMAVADMVDSKDHFAKEHSMNVALIAEELARRLGWSKDRIIDLHYIALLHDIGKIGIPDSILNKPDVYTKEEYDLVKGHTGLGSDILENISIPNVKQTALLHHERYDGNGYPTGLSGEDIPIEARIVALADAYDAMTNDRSYRKKNTDEYVRKELLEGAGTQFDPELVPIMISMMDDGYFSKTHTKEAYVINDSLAGNSTNLLHKVIMEVTNEVQAEANKDVLTGLWNRKYACQTIDRMLSLPQGKGTAFMMDIDNFKKINDEYGHIMGDEVLITISRVLNDVVRSKDVACRIGGDEFFIYFHGLTQLDNIANLATRIIHRLSDCVTYPDGSTGVSSSIGIAIAPKDGTCFEELYARADKALYLAKNNGKGVYHIYSGDVEETTDTNSIQEDLDSIRRMLSEEEPISGSYYVEYEGFKNISRFIRRSVERKDRDVVYILFTLTGRKNTALPSEDIPIMMKCLEESVHDSLRIGDVATRYSSTQMVVILIDTNEENSKVCANRIFGDFVKRIPHKNVELHYDLQQLQL